MSEPQRRRWPLQTGGRHGNSNTWIADLCVFFFNRRFNGEYYKWLVLPHGSRDALQPSRVDEERPDFFLWGETCTFIIWKRKCVPKCFNPRLICVICSVKHDLMQGLEQIIKRRDNKSWQWHQSSDLNISLVHSFLLHKLVNELIKWGKSKTIQNEPKGAISSKHDSIHQELEKKPCTCCAGDKDHAATLYIPLLPFVRFG